MVIVPGLPGSEVIPKLLVLISTSVPIPVSRQDSKSPLLITLGVTPPSSVANGQLIVPVVVPVEISTSTGSNNSVPLFPKGEEAFTFP